MKSKNEKLGFSTESGRRFEPEREEKEDGEGDEDREAGIVFQYFPIVWKGSKTMGVDSNRVDNASIFIAQMINATSQ